MKEDAFRAHLRARMGGPAAASCLSRVRRIERELRLDLSGTVLDEASILEHVERLRAGGILGGALANCASALRSYAVFEAQASNSTAVVTRMGRQPEVVPPAAPAIVVPAHLAQLTVLELMRFYSEVLAELRSRGITRTGNGPVGDYAEMLFARAFGWRLAGNSEASMDAVDVAGTRYQIKARRLSHPSASRQLSALRRLPERGFDVLAAILFDADLTVSRGVLIPIEMVMASAKRVEHTNSWRLMLSDRLCNADGVVDVTETLRRCANDPREDESVQG